ncbi:FIG022199: FAD-binding protein [hydrothermal vent metagenome]|uniref:FIG022199: FAD-binding protein n=1 Tax=hydrothermal vent metagenome TaxID=652676 RepID=A0A3B0WB43_9ZZZZ
MTINKNYDVFIIGAGPAGSIAGAKLVQAGFKVKLVEKMVFPRFVIGESLLPRCNQLLEQANMLECIQQSNFQIKPGVAFQTESALEVIHFEQNLGESFNSSFQVKREAFDHELLLDAEKKGVEVEFESEVVAFDQEACLITVKMKSGVLTQYQVKKLIDASGYGRVLPRLLKLDKPSEQCVRKAIFCRMTGDIRPEPNGKDGYIFVDIHDNNQAWIWNIPFNDGVTSTGIVCDEAYFNQFNLSEAEFFDMIIERNSTASKRYKDATKINEVGFINGYSAAVTKLFDKKFVLVGNASEFLDPVFSSGVTLALESGYKAAELTIDELNGTHVNWQTDYADYMMVGINVFREYVNAWYDGRLQAILFGDDRSEKVTRSVVSVLSGYVWNEENVFVSNPKKMVDTIYQLAKINE